MVVSATHTSALLRTAPNIRTHRPAWYPPWHPGDLVVIYDDQPAIDQPPAKRRRQLCECRALERRRCAMLPPWVWRTAGPPVAMHPGWKCSSGAFTR
jgi:hypothetical protein